MKKIILLGCLSLLNYGCLLHRPAMHETVTRTEEKPNGQGHTNVVTTVEERNLKLTTFSVWPGRQSNEGARMSMGKTLTVGVTGVDQESASTNAVRQLEAATQLLRAASGH